MSALYRKRYTPLDRSKLAQVRRKPKLRALVKSLKKIEPRPKLSERKAKLKQGETAKIKQARRLLRNASGYEVSWILSQLNEIIESQRLAWVQSSNLRDRILRGRL